MAVGTAKCTHGGRAVYMTVMSGLGSYTHRVAGIAAGDSIIARVDGVVVEEVKVSDTNDLSFELLSNWG